MPNPKYSASANERTHDCCSKQRTFLSGTWKEQRPSNALKIVETTLVQRFRPGRKTPRPICTRTRHLRSSLGMGEPRISMGMARCGNGPFLFDGPATQPPTTEKLPKPTKVSLAVDHTISMTRTTPARTHFAVGAFVRRPASNTYVGPLCWVLYTGHLGGRGGQQGGGIEPCHRLLSSSQCLPQIYIFVPFSFSLRLGATSTYISHPSGGVPNVGTIILFHL